MELLGKHGQRVKRLRRRVRSRQAGEVVVDGRRIVDDLLRWDLEIRELYLATEVAESELGQRWAELVDECYMLEATVLAGVATTRSPQGVLAVVEEPLWPPWPARSGVALFLHGVQDPGNVGAIVRSAAGLGAAAVLLSPGSADPFHPAAVRGSAGAVFRLPIAREITAARAVQQVRGHGGEAWATGGGGSPVDQWHPGEPTLILLGAEGAGLHADSVELADGLVTIPLDREIESLNVAVAAGVLLQHLRVSRSRP